MMWTPEQDRYYEITRPEDAYRIASRELTDGGRVRLSLCSEGVCPRPVPRKLIAADQGQVFNDYRVSRGSDGWHVSGPEGFYKHFHQHQRLHAELFAAALNLNLDEVGRIGRELRGIA